MKRYINLFSVLLLLLAVFSLPVFAGLFGSDNYYILKKTGDGNSVVFGCPLGQALRDFNSGSGLFTCVSVSGGSGIDTNWQTSWSVFDANMKATYQTKLSLDTNTVNVKAFGAKGDGSTDDTVSIQSALDSNANVYFPQGTYKITKDLNINYYNSSLWVGTQLGDARRFYGDGIGRTIIRQYTAGANGFHISHNFGIQFRDFTLLGTGADTSTGSGFDNNEGNTNNQWDFRNLEVAGWKNGFKLMVEDTVFENIVTNMNETHYWIIFGATPANNNTFIGNSVIMQPFSYLTGFPPSHNGTGFRIEGGQGYKIYGLDIGNPDLNTGIKLYGNTTGIIQGLSCEMSTSSTVFDSSSAGYSYWSIQGSALSMWQTPLPTDYAIIMGSYTSLDLSGVLTSGYPNGSIKRIFPTYGRLAVRGTAQGKTMVDVYEGSTLLGSYEGSAIDTSVKEIDEIKIADATTKGFVRGLTYQGTADDKILANIQKSDGNYIWDNLNQYNTDKRNGDFNKFIEYKGTTLINTSGATITANSYYTDHTPAKAFDGNILNWWWSNASWATSWIKINLGTPKIIDKIVWEYKDTENLAGIIQGSNNDSTWTTLGTFSHTAQNTWYTDSFVNNNPYQYYKMSFTNGDGTSWVGIYEMYLYGNGVQTSGIDFNIADGNVTATFFKGNGSLLTGITSGADTNWQTSWGLFDANMRSYFQLIGNYLTVAQGDANYWAKTNNFITVAQADTNYYSKADVNSNFVPYVGATKDVNIGTKNYRTDANVYAGTNIGIRTTTPNEALEVNYGKLRFNQEPRPGAITATLNTNDGNLSYSYYYRVTFVTAEGETEGGDTGNYVTTVNQQIDLSGIPTGTSRVTARKIYRTTKYYSNDRQRMYLIATINDNTTTTYTDNIVDPNNGSGTICPQANTTGGQIKMNGSNFLASGNTLTSIGVGAGITGDSSIFIGAGAGAVVTSGYNNVAVGVNSLTKNTTGINNVAVGAISLTAVTTGVRNVGVGRYSLGQLTTGNDNVGVGNNAGLGITTSAAAIRNIFIGSGAGQDGVVAGGDNTCIGANAGKGVAANTYNNNTFIGGYSGYVVTTGSNNSALGLYSLYALTSGGYNSCIGLLCGGNITTGSYNITLGSYVNVPTATTSGQLNIGNVLFGTGLYQTASMSSTPTATGKIGIGITTPQNTLNVNGDINASGSSGNIFADQNISTNAFYKVRGNTGLDYNAHVLKDVDLVMLTKTFCDLNYIGGVLVASTC